MRIFLIWCHVVGVFHIAQEAGKKKKENIFSPFPFSFLFAGKTREINFLRKWKIWLKEIGKLLENYLKGKRGKISFEGENGWRVEMETRTEFFKVLFNAVIK